MEILGVIILAGFIVATIIIAVERWKYKEFGINTDNDHTMEKSFGFGYVLGLLLAIFVALAMGGSSDPQATYYVNGIVVKGGTNWMIVVVTFMIGGGVIGLLIQLFSALPIYVMRSVSKEYRQSQKLHRQEMKERCAAGILPTIYRKKSLAVFLVLVTGGIGYWFYMKMWRTGCLYCLIMIVGGVCGNLMGVSIVPIAFVWLLLILAIVNMLIAFRKKEIKLKNRIISFE